MTKQIRVIGAAVVLSTTDANERYLYRDAVVSAGGFTEESVQRAVDNGLVIEDAPAPAEDDAASAADAPAESWSHARLDAWALAQEPPLVFDESVAETGKALTKAQKLEQIAALAK